ncbi:hypothetical protein [Nocardia pseudovaccinii]|uniref:hypothetical protein n=1 Tax=Nocardia pseudovaccinii TaxID=189540 RepID=UPI0007A53E58|nr:hypothetical protein [Nocardia pseudovaccinii]
MSDFDDRRETGTPYQQQPYGTEQFGPALGQPGSGTQSGADAGGLGAFGAPVELDPAALSPFGPEPTATPWNGGVAPALPMPWQPEQQTASAPGQFDPTLQWAPQPAAAWQPGSATQFQPGATPSGPHGGMQAPHGPGGGPNASFGDRFASDLAAASSANRPSRGRRTAWIAAAIATVVVAGGATAAIVTANHGSDDTAAQNPVPSMVSALTPTGSHTSHTSTQPTTTKHAPANNETPVVPGYQVVVASDLGAAYDVPADWTVAPDGKVGGFGDPPNAVTGKGLATDGKSYCPGSTRTVAFLTGSKDTDSATAATELGTRTAKIAYTNSPGGTPGAAQPLRSLDGSQQGMFVETKGTATKVNPGCATEYSVYTFATPTDSGNFVMVIAADTGVPNAVDAATAMRIFTSIRPHGG